LHQQKEAELDGSRIPTMRRLIRRMKIDRIAIGIALTVPSSLILLWIVAYPDNRLVSTVWAYAIWMPLLVSPLVVGIISLSSGLTLRCLMVNDKGIHYPCVVNLRDILLFKNPPFLPFSEIEAIYPNLNGDLPYVTIRITEELSHSLRVSRNFRLDKEFIYDLSEFLKVVAPRTRIVRTEDLQGS